jgi:hypothetical protein
MSTASRGCTNRSARRGPAMFRFLLPKHRQATVVRPTDGRVLHVEPLEDRRLLSVWTVNSLLDKVDRNPGNGVVNTGVAGEVTLRAAIMEANAKPGTDTINIPAGYYSLTRANPAGVEDEQAGKQGDLDIRDSLIIKGSTTGTTTINAGRLDRVFHVQAGYVTLKNLTITGGQTRATVYPYTSFGGGILNNSVLTVIDCTVDANIVFADIAAYGAGIATTGPLIVRNSVISNNAAFANYRSKEYGGGIYGFNTSPVTIDNSIIFHNGATQGGGVFLDGVGNASITRTTVSDNYSVEMIPGPGGVWTQGSTLNIQDCWISDNQGAGFLNGGWGTIVDSTVTGNDERAGILNTGTLTVQNVAVYDNPGGGISNSNDATMTVINSTVTGNASGIGNS